MRGVATGDDAAYGRSLSPCRSLRRLRPWSRCRCHCYPVGMEHAGGARVRVRRALTGEKCGARLWQHLATAGYAPAHAAPVRHGRTVRTARPSRRCAATARAARDGGVSAGDPCASDAVRAPLGLRRRFGGGACTRAAHADDRRERRLISTDKTAALVVPLLGHREDGRAHPLLETIALELLRSDAG